MKKLSRRLDNTAKIFSVEEKNNINIFRLSVILKEQIDPEILKLSVIKTLNIYPSYKVRIKTSFFWNYLKVNLKDPIVEEEKYNHCEGLNFINNNDYLFKVTYLNNKINLDIFHILTDGIGATILLKGILYNYLNLKYNLKTTNQDILKNIEFDQDQYLKNADIKLVSKRKYKKAFLIKEKSNISNNKTYHYILNLKQIKNISRKNNVSITEYLTAIYIYSIYKTIYDKSSNKDIVITIPIDLRNHYNVQTFSNFFTCMDIQGNVLNNKNISFNTILTQIHNEFKNKLTTVNIKKYLSRDVKLGTNIVINLVPLVIKKLLIKYLGKLVTSNSTTTLSNIGQIKLEEQYRKYVNNIMILVSTGKIQKVKCTVCSYENNLTITINSSLTSNNLEKEFYNLLKKYVGTVNIESNIIKN